MKAVVQNAYGSPKVLNLKEVDMPSVKENEVLIRVGAAAVNAGDAFMMKGSPWIARFFVGTHEYLDVLGELIESGKIAPVIDRTYKLSETPEAIGYVGEGHASGKVVISMEHDR